MSSEPARLLVVDDEPSVTRVVATWLEREGYGYEVAGSASEALEHLERDGPFDIVLTDIMLPKMSGIDLLKVVKERDPDVQVIVMTGNASIDLAIQAIRSSADDYLAKPFALNQLHHAVTRALEHRALLQENRAYRLHLEEKVSEQAQQIERLFLDGLAALASAIEARDGYTGEHLDRVSHYAMATGVELGLDDEQMWSLWLGSLFHDVGKLAIPDAILNKPGPLSDEEYEVMKKHPEFGVRIIEKVSFLQAAAPGILHHQEHWDGSGYPAGLKGGEISIEGRILAVCDAFDAMLTDRPYREARTMDEAIAELKRCAGTHFDPQVVEALLRAREKGFPYEPPVALYEAAVARRSESRSDGDGDGRSDGAGDAAVDGGR